MKKSANTTRQIRNGAAVRIDTSLKICLAKPLSDKLGRSCRHAWVEASVKNKELLLQVPKRYPMKDVPRHLKKMALGFENEGRIMRIPARCQKELGIKLETHSKAHYPVKFIEESDDWVTLTVLLNRPLQ